MELPSNQSRPRLDAQGPNSSRANPNQSPATAFLSEDTEWHHRIIDFLETHPNSSLLAVVQHLWPDFLNFSTDRRARVWFRVKAQLHAMERIGVLQYEMCDTEISVWAVRRQ